MALARRAVAWSMRAGADAGEVVVAVQFVLGEGHFGAVGGDGGLGLGDHRALAFQGSAGVFQLGAGDQGVGVGGLGGGAEVAVVNQRQQLPGLDALVVLDQHFLDKTSHTRRHQGEVGGDEGVVGGLALAAEHARCDQINQHADGKYGDNGDGNFVFAFHEQSFNQVGARGGKIRVGIQKISRINATATAAMT